MSLIFEIYLIAKCFHISFLKDISIKLTLEYPPSYSNHTHSVHQKKLTMFAAVICLMLNCFR